MTQTTPCVQATGKKYLYSRTKGSLSHRWQQNSWPNQSCSLPLCPREYSPPSASVLLWPAVLVRFAGHHPQHGLVSFLQNAGRFEASSTELTLIPEEKRTALITYKCTAYEKTLHTFRSSIRNFNKPLDIVKIAAGSSFCSIIQSAADTG